MRTCGIRIHKWRFVWVGAVYWKCKNCGRVKKVQ